MPWSLICDIIFKLIGLSMVKSEKQRKLKKQAFEFINRYDDSISDNITLRKEYDEILKASLKKEGEGDDESDGEENQEKKES